MTYLEALILGLIQGLTEFLPVSSSGHLILGEEILGVQSQENLLFAVVVHGATVLSTIVIFFRDILQLIKGLLKFQWNKETRYVAMILTSMIPVVLVGLFFKDQLELLFDGNVLLVGLMLLITAVLLAFTYWAKVRKASLGFGDALLIGVAQAIAVLPGISRSGATISTGLLLGKDKEQTARFSFLMVLLPIIAANFMQLMDKKISQSSIDPLVLLLGFLAAFLSGLLACRWMLRLVKRSKLIYFAVYCGVVGFTALLYALFFMS